jgi:hypothetical protein
VIISDKYNFIVFAIPHTGSSSTQRLLEPYGWCSFSEENHLTPNHVRAHVKIRGNLNWSKYCKVTVVRNPWDRFPAMMLAINNHNKVEPKFANYNLPNPTYKNFEEYAQSGFYDGMLQQEFMYTFDNEVVMDFILKFENLKEDTIKLLQKFNLPIPEQIRHDNNWNITPDSKIIKRKHYTEYYTEQWMIDTVAEKEKFVIENCGYKFGEDGDRWR